MKVEPLPPIPSPPEHHWRQFRVKALPFVAFGAVLVVVVWLWGLNLANPLIMGQAEGPKADVTSPVDGLLSQLMVTLYQEVKVGDPIAVVSASDPQVLSNTVTLIQAEMAAIKAEGGFDAGARVRYAQFQMDWLTRRSELATAKAMKLYADAEFQRIQKLKEDGISSQFELDVAQRDMETARREVEEITKTVEAAGKALRELDPEVSGSQSPGVKAALAVASEELRLAESELQPVVLRAPIDGQIIDLKMLQQASVVRGSVIATIASPTVDRINGFIGQPIRLEPKVGMTVEVRSRGLKRVVGEAKIAFVGPRIVLFDAPLRVRGMGASQERGLPIVLTVPPGMPLLPGEFVDVTLPPTN